MSPFFAYRVSGAAHLDNRRPILEQRDSVTRIGVALPCAMASTTSSIRPNRRSDPDVCCSCFLGRIAVSRSVLRTSVVVVMYHRAARGMAERPSGEPTADGPFKGGIVVVGDSITAEYNDEPGDDMQGWWSMVGRHFGATSPRTRSRVGLPAAGPRLQRQPLHRPSRGVPRHRTGPVHRRGRAERLGVVHRGPARRDVGRRHRPPVDHYLDVLQANLPRSTRILVLGPPWGTLDQLGRTA